MYKIQTKEGLFFPSGKAPALTGDSLKLCEEKSAVLGKERPTFETKHTEQLTPFSRKRSGLLPEETQSYFPVNLSDWKPWLPDRVGSGTGTARAVVDRSQHFPVVAWGTSTAGIASCVIPAVLRHIKESQQFKTTNNHERNFIFPQSITVHSFQSSLSAFRAEEPFMQR